jgi:hypothetical protein
VDEPPRVLPLSLSDVGRMTNNLVAAERESRLAWASHPDDTKAGILLAVRDTLLRLLQDPHWVSSALSSYVNLDAVHRVDVTFTVDLTEMHKRFYDYWESQAEDARDNLLAMAKKLAQPDT